ncbi:MAG: imelysin family protein [Sulfurimonas sp.]|nr:imelysin family protein [Sulfurimonas sp.]
MIKLLSLALSFAIIVMFSACLKNEVTPHETQSDSVLLSYVKIANENYKDVLIDAKALQDAVNRFALNPSKTTLTQAKKAWLQARESYGTSEIFRLANGPIDAVEEGLNAWPLDENIIDYTIDAKGQKTSGNIIDSTGMFHPSGEESFAVDITNISQETLSALHENGGTANITTGYHAVEFLLWGQDQDYSNFLKDFITNGAMQAGNRPLSDFTTDANAKRRLAYLQAVSAKIVTDLSLVSSSWIDGDARNYRALLLAGDAKEALKTIYAAMGVFIKSELANERIAVAVLTPSEEDEHSCFSDNTHRDIATNYQGFKNVIMATYKGAYYGTSPLDAMSIDAKAKLLHLMLKIENKIASIDTIAKTSRHFDYQIRPNDPQSRVILKLKNELRKLGDMMVIIAKQNGIRI